MQDAREVKSNDTSEVVQFHPRGDRPDGLQAILRVALDASLGDIGSLREQRTPVGGRLVRCIGRRGRVDCCSGNPKPGSCGADFVGAALATEKGGKQ